MERGEPRGLDLGPSCGGGRRWRCEHRGGKQRVASAPDRRPDHRRPPLYDQSACRRADSGPGTAAAAGRTSAPHADTDGHATCAHATGPDATGANTYAAAGADSGIVTLAGRLSALSGRCPALSFTLDGRCCADERADALQRRRLRRPQEEFTGR
jgi:hypothetical protein